MKKSLILASILMLSSSVLLASNTKEWFVGGEFGGMKVNTKTTGVISGVSQSVKGSYKPTYESLKFGRYYDTSRVYGFYARQNKKDAITANTFGVGYDYLFKNFKTIVPFVGVQAMYTKAKIDSNNLRISGVDTPSGASFGVGTGVIYPVTNNIELEAGVRYVTSSIDDSNTFPNGNSIKIEMKDYTQYYVGLNYRF